MLCNRICRRFVSNCDYVNGNGCLEHIYKIHATIDARDALTNMHYIWNSNQPCAAAMHGWYSIQQIAKCTIALSRFNKKQTAQPLFYILCYGTKKHSLALAKRSERDKWWDRVRERTKTFISMQWYLVLICEVNLYAYAHCHIHPYDTCSYMNGGCKVLPHVFPVPL